MRRYGERKDEDDAGEDAGQSQRQDDAAEPMERGRSERRARLVAPRIEKLNYRVDRQDHEWPKRIGGAQHVTGLVNSNPNGTRSARRTP